MTSDVSDMTFFISQTPILSHKKNLRLRPRVEEEDSDYDITIKSQQTYHTSRHEILICWRTQLMRWSEFTIYEKALTVHNESPLTIDITYNGFLTLVIRYGSCTDIILEKGYTGVYHYNKLCSSI